MAAWKRLEAQPLAKKRADELAKIATESGKELAVALADQSITGISSGTMLTVTESDKFSFYQESAAADPMNRQPSIRLGNPTGVENAGRGFMQTVFEQLADGEIGVALNDDASVYYVVKVFDRNPADRDEFKESRAFDASSALNSIRQAEFDVVRGEYFERMREKYAIRIKELPQRNSRSVEMDDDF